MAVHWGGVAGMIFFYLLILGIGLWASRRNKASNGTTSTERVMVAGRDFGWFVGLFTLVATWVGGGYINGAAEIIFTKGLVWGQAPWGYSLSLAINGLFFAKKMRSANYVTMIDPFQIKFGNRMGGIIFLSALMGEILWCSSILAALGSTLSVILELDQNLSVILSACIAASYTLFGGLLSVAYTDIVQLACIFIGLWFCFPFTLTNKAVAPLSETSDLWLGTLEKQHVGQWIDKFFLCIFGGVPWQAYCQRILAFKSPKHAQYISYVSAFICITFAIPGYLMGAVGLSTDWNMTSINLNKTDIYENPGLVLPAVIQYLTSPAVAFLGLGAISAAVMSSTDSSVLASSSMFVRNIYRNLIRPKASDKEMIWVLRASVIVVATVATILALTIKSIYVLFVLCSDLVFVVLFPQLVCVIHIEKSNTYGSALAVLIGLFLRLGGGEDALHIPAFIHYPFYDEEYGQLFPFRTLAALVSFLTLVGVSYGTDFIFRRGYLQKKWDVFRCVVNVDDKVKANEKANIQFEQLSQLQSAE